MTCDKFESINIQYQYICNKFNILIDMSNKTGVDKDNNKLNETDEDVKTTKYESIKDPFA